MTQISETDAQFNRLPERMPAIGEEPTGERINLYHKPKSIDSILNALTGEEIKFLRRSNFGKLIATSERPPFSSSFGQYIFTRMLKVSKKTRDLVYIFQQTRQSIPARVCNRYLATV